MFSSAVSVIDQRTCRLEWHSESCEQADMQTKLAYITVFQCWHSLSIATFVRIYILSNNKG